MENCRSKRLRTLGNPPEADKRRSKIPFQRGDGVSSAFDQLRFYFFLRTTRLFLTLLRGLRVIAAAFSDFGDAEAILSGGLSATSQGGFCQ
jgi:hypothetical protein